MDILDIIFCFFFLIVGYKLKDTYKAFSEVEKKMLNKIFFFHIIMCCIAAPICFKGGDAKFYWLAPKNMYFDDIWQLVILVGRSTSIMLLINYFFSNTLSLSFFSGMILYSFIGYWGFIYILLIIKKLIPNYLDLADTNKYKIPMIPLVFFLPNTHFWSVSIGKDTLCFFGVILFIYSIISIKKRLFQLLIGSIILFFIRPHVLLFLVVAFGLAFIIKGKIEFYRKVFITLIMTIVFFPLLNAVFKLAKIDQLNSESIDKFNHIKSTALSKAGSGLDISSYSYPYKVFTFLFRPLFFDAFNLLSIICSIENLILLILFMKFIKNNPFKIIFKMDYIILGSLFFYIIGAIAFAPVMSNLGTVSYTHLRAHETN
jgi:hypothetical protein